MHAVIAITDPPRVVPSAGECPNQIAQSSPPLWLVWAGIISLQFIFMIHLSTVHRQAYYGHNDFLGLYAGGKLAGSASLYNPDRMVDIQLQFAGATAPAIAYTRLPAFAFLIKPLALLDYHVAYVIWQLLCLSSLVGAIYAFPIAHKRLLLLAVGTSVPLYCSFANGQDLPFVLLFLALALRLLHSGRSLCAGLVFSLCLLKFHLFVMLPLWLVARKRWRAFGGFIVGTIAILGFSFTIAAPHWPVEYINLILTPRVNPALQSMPNLRGLFHGLPFSNALELSSGVVIAGVCWYVFRKANPPAGFAAGLSGGLLLSHHAYLADSVLLAPAALLTLHSGASSPVRIAAWVLVLPFVYARPSVGFGPLYILLPLAAIALIAAVALDSFRTPHQTVPVEIPL